MPRVDFSKISVYALIDSDSDEARTFTTYMGYWACLADHVEYLYGDECSQILLAELRSRRSFRKLSGQGKPTNPDDVRALLLNGWTSELRLNLIDLEDRKRLILANHGAPIDAYYATSRHATAWLCARDGAAPTTHRGLLNAIAAQTTGSRLYPPPWNLFCTAVEPHALYAGFNTPPGKCSNLAVTADRDARAAMLLRTTRKRGVDQRVQEVKQQLKLNRAPNGERKRQDQKLPATTIFDFAWRMRARSNYGDPAMFYVGSLGFERARTYAAAVRTWTNATMFLFESLIAQRAKALLEDTAVHFISRDQSQLAETLIVPRLQALGLLTGSTHPTKKPSLLESISA
jgi:hypothetical protein